MNLLRRTLRLVAASGILLALSALATPPSGTAAEDALAGTAAPAPEALPAWTNHAGHVLRAIPEAIEDGRIRLAGTWMPLDIFPATEQTRLRAWFGERPLLPADAQTYATLRWMLDRVDGLAAKGVLSADEATARRQSLLAAIDTLHARAETP